MKTGVSVRTLASPGFVFALVLLILNDHFMKQAWPGWVTGKLSDVAGLVVAPLLLGVLLTAWRVPRPMPAALLATGGAFTLAKASTVGAAVASAVWSLTGVPTLIRADVTDVLALPALYGAWLVHRQVSARPAGDWRSTVSRATGVAMLPLAVLATAATDCYDSPGVDNLQVVSGRFAGGPPRLEERIGVQGLLLAGNGTLASPDEVELRFPEEASPWRVRAACDDDGTCWRIDPDVTYVPSVQMSPDGGRTWYRDLWVTPDQRDQDLEGAPRGCGGDPSRLVLTDLVVLRDGTSVRVAVAAGDAGIYVRTVGGRWSHYSIEDIGDLLSGQVKVRGPLSDVPPHTPPHDPPPGLPSETPSLPPEPTCDAPSTVSVTPNPQNGPPTSYVLCP
jgi:hypothetical protein